MSQIYLRKLPQDAQATVAASESIRLALSQIERLTSLIENLLDVSRLESGRFRLRIESNDFVDVVRQVAKRFQDQILNADCQLILNLPDQLEGDWDRPRLEQIVANLLSNAIKFGAHGSITISLFEKNSEAVLQIRDEGSGIPASVLPNLFGRYQRGEENMGGLGLGLYLVRELVAAHRGRIEVETETNRGSLFTVSIPIHQVDDIQKLRESPRLAVAS